MREPGEATGRKGDFREPGGQRHVIADNEGRVRAKVGSRGGFGVIVVEREHRRVDVRVKTTRCREPTEAVECLGDLRVRADVVDRGEAR